MNLYVVVPNLDRRPNRWNVCQSLLLQAGTPPENIIRIASKDGSDYGSINEIKLDAQNYFGTLPEWLEHNPHRNLTTEVAWNYTWYICLETISNFSEGDYGLLLIDDIKLLVSFSELVTHVARLARKHPIKMIGISLCDSIRHRRLIPDTPFQFGLTTELDTGNIFSPAGARFYQDYANRNCMLDDPLILQQKLVHSPHITGIFGLNATYPDPRGMVTFNRHPQISNESDRAPKQAKIRRH